VAVTWTGDGRGPPEAWEAFADGILRGEALLSRVVRGIPHRDLPGLYVDDEDVDRILAELGAPAEVPPALGAGLLGLVADRRGRFHLSLRNDSRFARMVGSATLSPDEAEVLALLAAVEMDERRQRLAVYVQDSVHLPRLALGTLDRLFPPPHAGVRAVAPDARLARAALVQVEDGGPWATRMASVARRAAWVLAGDDSPDQDLPQDAAMVDPAGADPGGEDLLLVVGPDRATRLGTAFRRCRGARFVVTPAPGTPEGWRAVVREATVSGRSVVLDLDRELSAEGRFWIERGDHLGWALCSSVELALDRLPERGWVEVREDDGRATPEDWALAFGGADGNGHRLGREQVRLAGLAARGLGGDVHAAVRRLASGHLDALAVQIRPSRAWTDLVLPPDQLDELHELVARHRHRETVHERWGFPAVPSPGLVALFAGPSGTGKTLAAEVVAGQLGLDAYKVDLSAVVSKYIGETEKNLERIFSGASAGNVVLFFDEADALFGKRSEVGDAHDRYANIEVSYLLQRLESYPGMVVMATNLHRNIDAAFLRRIHVSVEFPMPDEEGRRAIWALSFPPEAPTEALDVDFLARQFRISGGSIRNASLTAAFLAADAGTRITMELVVLGLKREFQKLGRLRTEAEFDRYFDLVRGEPDAAPVG
jgi:hypothetical protein